jgi:uncharacterized protein
LEIPLFPLRTVLFPGMPLQLRIFEERYKVMVNELLASGGSFGVVLIREGEEVGGGAIPQAAGTTARIEQCAPLDGGRFALTARGVRRFRIVRMLAPRPYPYGDVELLDDRRAEESPRLNAALETVRTTFPAYFRLALSLTDQWAQAMRLPSDPHRLVNFVAPWLQVEEETKQKLLELESAADRMAQLAVTIDDVLGRTREQVAEYRRRKFLGLGALN